MLENIGKRIQAFMLIFIIVLLSLVMGIIGFGTPGSEGCAAEGPGYAARVYGETITEGEFRAAYTLTGFNRYPTDRARTLRLREYTLDGLIERALLVREGEQLGFTADPDEVTRKVAEDEVIYLSGPVDAPRDYPAGALQQNFRDRNGNFSADNLRRTIQYHLRRSVEEFVTWQVQETIANQVRETVTASVSVSPREAWDAYVQETERARLSYVRFDPAYYRERVEVTDDAVSAWMQAHADEVDAEYRRQRHRYTNLDEQTHARHVLIGVEEDASDEVRAEKRRLAEDLLRRARAGEDFAALARDNSTDEGSAQSGGDLGWFPRGRMVPPFEEAAFTIEPGTVGEALVESRFGFHIINVLGRRSGDVPEDEAKREVAEDLYRQARSAAMAEEAAGRALAYLREGHTTDELDERLLHDWAEQPVPAEGVEPTPEDESPEAEERDSRAPQVRETTNFGRSERAIPGPFDAGPLTTAAFEMSVDSPLPDAPLQLGDNWVVFRLDERMEATEEGFDDDTRDRLRRRLLSEKRLEVLSAYIGRLRARAEADGAIRINPSILSYGATDEEEEGADSEETASN
jgi:peptidyl-prolyl cis-trans isomerase D